MSNALKDARPIPSDATLVWLASERAAPLFRTLDRTKSFGPLVVVLATLPPMLAAFGESVTARDAAWGLRALDATGSEMPEGAAAVVEAAVPSATVRTAALWLSAGLMRLTDPSLPVSGSLASLIGGTLLLGAFWPLARSLSGRRLAFWAVLLAAFHPALVESLRCPSPVTIGLAASVGAFWGSLNLDGKPGRAALIWTGTVFAILIAFAICGPVAFAVPAVIAGDALFASFLAGRGAIPRPTGRGAAATPAELVVRRLSAVLVAVGLWAAFEAAGTGLLRDGLDLSATGGALLQEVEAADTPIVGPLWGLAAIGLGRLLRVVPRRATSRSPRPVPRLVLVWLAAAAGLAIWRGGTVEGAFDPTGRYAVAFASLPILLAAAYAIEEASRRAVSGAWVLLAVALPLAVRLGTLMATARTDSPASLILLIAAGGAVVWLASKAIPAAVPMSGLRRGVLMAAILLAAAVNSVDGVAVLLADESGDDAYERVAGRLRRIGPADAAVLVAESPPVRLAFAVRASFPAAEIEISPSWGAVAALLDHRTGAALPAVAIGWGVPADGAGTRERLGPAEEPLLFEGRELVVYEVPAKR